MEICFVGYKDMLYTKGSSTAPPQPPKNGDEAPTAGGGKCKFFSSTVQHSLYLRPPRSYTEGISVIYRDPLGRIPRGSQYIHLIVKQLR